MKLRTPRQLFRLCSFLFTLSVALGASAAFAGRPPGEDYSDSDTAVMQAYIAYYGRPPDPAGFHYWVDRLEREGGKLDSIIAAFGESREFTERFGHLNHAELISNIYRQLFNREPDPEGLAFYQAQLDSEEMGLGNIAIRILTGARNADLQAVENKFAASAYFTEEILRRGLEIPVDAGALSTLLRQVVPSDFSLNAWYASVDNLIDGWNSGSIVPFASEQALADYLKDAFIQSSNMGGYYLREDIALADSTPVDIGNGTKAVGLFSKTTLQEEGVDEADRIKTDGTFLYIIPDHEDRYYLKDEAMLGAAGDVASYLRVMQMTATSSHEAARIDLSHLKHSVDGIYLLTDHDAGQPDLLVTLGGSSQTPFGSNWAEPWRWQSASTEVAFFDVDNPTDPQYLSTIQMDGQLIASRRINQTLYLVTRHTPSPEGFQPYPISALDEERNRKILDDMELKDLLPHYRVDGQDLGSLVNPITCFLPPADPDRVEQPVLVSVTAIDLTAPSLAFSSSVAGPVETVYVGPRSVYLATRQSSYYLPTDGLRPNVASSHPQHTVLHKFALTDDSGPAYRGTGSVTGNLGWDEGKKPFRMGEHEGVLRIATSIGDDWVNTTSTRLTLLRETQTGALPVLEEVSHLDHIGKQGERLYASRFIGDRAYLVTFRVTDPLYVFDLSDPARIITLSEISIDGYSDYLYPLGPDLLLGIGKDAVPDQSAGDLGGRGAWYQGVKIALFDVSGPRGEIDSVILGKRGTESDALYDHHAVTLLRSDEQDIVRLALPIRLHDAEQVPSGAEPWTYYPWTQTGLYLFEVPTRRGEERIEEAGSLIVADSASGPEPFTALGADRSVLVDDTVHYVHGGKTWTSVWDDTGIFYGPE